MSNTKQQTSAFLRKDGWVRYVMWGLAVLMVGLGVFVVIKIMNNKVSLAVPGGYRFVVADSNGTDETTYYVYDDKIITDTVRTVEGMVVKTTTMVYDSVDTSRVVYNEEDATIVCMVSECKNKKKPLAVAKDIISHNAGREFIGK